ncbi:extracellular mutant protein 11-domain-containing protein [Rhypophila decipiens]|uniref:Extracellular mutant protein 11-domain-containing protein n=1 Tax=Rhypophila decipiens TaxID=261697 RepID=A0AAN7BC76_9PEZI|nr:extracellular mutant protein 11-domain-containing protein [Rhypophila decipiens]
MMPTARRKLALFTGRGADNRATGMVVGPAPTTALPALPVKPAPPLTADTGHTTLLPKLQPPIQISRQQPAISSAHAPDDQFHSQQQTATSASRSLPQPKAGRFAVASMQSGKNAWDDSTVASFISENGSTRSASVRHRGGQGQHHQTQNQTHRRDYSADAAYQRGHQHTSHHARGALSPSPPEQHDENLPFVIGGDGLLKVLPPPSDRHVHGAAAALNATISNNLFNDQTVKADEFYQDDRSVYDSPPAKFSALRRTRLPHRDATKRTSFSDAGGAGYTSDAQSIRLSPERNSEAGEEIEKVRQTERIRRDREREKSREVERLQLEREAQLERQRERERDLQNKRSTVFENLTPVDLEDPTSFNDTRAAVIAPTSEYTAEDPKEEALQRTPRANRQMPPPAGPVTTGINLFNKDGPFAQMTTHRLGESNPVPQTLKRRHSLDYDDAELNKMSFSDLRSQAFDYDPQAAAAVAAQQQTSSGSAAGTLEERMQHYKTKGSIDQHEFFTRLSANEWDAAGDWFLEQFADVVNRMKTARRDKRKLVEQFEDEISRREEAVRVKAEGIDKTLVDLKVEGQTMMAGKEMEIDF